MTEQSWRDDAACRDDWALFFPDGDTESAHLAILPAAKAVCDSCPAAKACLEFAMTTKQNAGIWGGTTPGQREALRLSAGRKDKPECDECGQPFKNRSALRWHAKTHATYCVRGHKRNGKPNCPTCKREKEARRRKRTTIAERRAA